MVTASRCARCGRPRRCCARAGCARCSPTGACRRRTSTRCSPRARICRLRRMRWWTLRWRPSSRIAPASMGLGSAGRAGDTGTPHRPWRAHMSVIETRVVNLAELKLEHFTQGGGFESRYVRIGPLLGAKDLGYSYDVVPPGKRSCPFHSHRAEEEMFFIVRGSGTLRYGNERRKIRAGDVICCPTGGPETAHQIINDSDEELAYLSISTMKPVEVCEYPDSDKLYASAGELRHIARAGTGLDYWDGEA